MKSKDEFIRKCYDLYKASELYQLYGLNYKGFDDFMNCAFVGYLRNSRIRDENSIKLRLEEKNFIVEEASRKWQEANEKSKEECIKELERQIEEFEKQTKDILLKEVYADFKNKVEENK